MAGTNPAEPALIAAAAAHRPRLYTGVATVTGWSR
jgi:hypothetical protein